MLVAAAAVLLAVAAAIAVVLTRTRREHDRHPTPAHYRPGSTDSRGRWQVSAIADVLPPLPPLDTEPDGPPGTWPRPVYRAASPPGDNSARSESTS
ncbi:hypothetical protein L3Q67_45070 (plasmid) [Saccharothrix sp. AJ9571]|nr:hypothetical protein L3Q67_45070 [Saccharothrix sp. AJ9571]